MRPAAPKALSAVPLAVSVLAGLAAVIGWGIAFDRGAELRDARVESERGRVFREEFHPRLQRGLSLANRAELYWRAGQPAVEIDGRIEAAMEVFDHIFEAEPDSDDLWAARAQMGLLQSRYEEVIGELGPFVADRPTSIARREYTLARALLYVRRAFALPAEGRQRDTVLEERRLQALRAAREFLEHRGRSEHAFLIGGLARLLEGRPAEAEAPLAVAVRLDATSPHVALAQAWLAAQAGAALPERPPFPRAVEIAALYARTADDWTRILEIDPGYAEAHLARSRLVAEGAADRARALELDPTLGTYVAHE